MGHVAELRAPLYTKLQDYVTLDAVTLPRQGGSKTTKDTKTEPCPPIEEMIAMQPIASARTLTLWVS